MTTYTCLWIEAAPQPQNTAPLLIQLTLVPQGDGGPHWRRQEGRTSAEQFTVVENQVFTAAEGGPQALLQRFIELRRHLADQGFTEVVVPDGLYAPDDLDRYRPKTGDECLMDLAMLHTECGDCDTALTLLHHCKNSGQEWFWHTAARRAHANRARANPGPAAQADWAAAVEHADFITASAARQGGDVYRMDTSGKGAGRVRDWGQWGEGYSFGDAYAGAPNQLSAAAQTLAEYRLTIAGQPEAALQAITISDSTSYGTQQVEEYRVGALLQLGRAAEAYQVHLAHGLQMPEVLASAGYQAFAAQQQAQQHEAERERRAALRFEYTPGAPASAADLERLRERFPAALEVSPAYRQWITDPGQNGQLTVFEGEHRSAAHRYTFFSIPDALEKHDDLIGWLNMYEGDFARELHQIIADSGIDPAHMLPIVGRPEVPDCFLLRTDGPDAGAVYFWSHEECAMFPTIVASADQLFPWLRARAEEGRTFSL